MPYSSAWSSFALTLLLLVAQVTYAFDPATILSNICEDLQPRLEIRELAQDRDQWEVFLLGLRHMQESNATDPSSYYAIAGEAQTRSLWPIANG
jgi:hypothetical protein